MNPLLLIKRPTDFVLFLYLALVISFLQADTRLSCHLMGVFGKLTFASILLIAASVAVLSLSVIITTFLPRYMRPREAIGGAMLHSVAFAIAAASGAALRLAVSPAPECRAIQWPLDSAQWIAVFVLVVVAASVFTGALNVITPQKADYSELAQRVRAYIQAVSQERIGSMTTVCDLLNNAYQSAERARMAEASARYEHAVRTAASEPLRTLLDIAETIEEEHPEEFLKYIGHRDPGLAPPDAVAAASRAQCELERTWWSPPRQ